MVVVVYTCACNERARGWIRARYMYIGAYVRKVDRSVYNMHAVPNPLYSRCKGFKERQARELDR